MSLLPTRRQTEARVSITRSSSSDSLSSSSTPPSSAPSATAPTYAILLNASASSLRQFATDMEPGHGDLFFTVVDSSLTNDISGSVKEAAGAVGVKLHCADRRWIKRSRFTDGAEQVYFVSYDSINFSGTGAKDSFEACFLPGAPFPATLFELTHAATLAAIASASLHVVYSAPSSGVYVLERLPFSFPPVLPTEGLTDASVPINPWGVPTMAEWRTLWAAWDAVTLGMIPSEMLHQKPIDLRHKCLFYIGHIPTFLDILLSKALKETYTEPRNFSVIFERGIDPHVDDPDYCHSHSEVPEADEEWPTLESILTFRDHVRARLLRVYNDIESGTRELTRSLARTLMMTLEHEGFHVETLLYMLIQRAGTGTLSPPGFSIPPWTALTAQWSSAAPALASRTTLGPAVVSLGRDDSEAEDDKPLTPYHEFGWDNENPKRAVHVKRIEIDWRPVTNGEFLVFWRSEKGQHLDMPSSWVTQDGEIMVRTLFGPVSFDVAEHWPLQASYDAFNSYAQSKGGRMPTEAELRLFFDTYEVGHAGGANVGFRNWHPVPATTGTAADGGRGSNGGVWEWTSDLFSGHDGLVPTKLFPGYSTDFFDGKHHVVIGASYATIPRLADRRTLRNFYQRCYPYAWVGGRVVYEVEE